ncbi:PREDICTED: uncharacterized protein LOC109580184 [Amphimedon queenslandica]|uniref:Death domain-containing protein n=1 Tax=Amphimedon queenslandica TaxID=400682 RepID=A0A1X7VV32_AMPQE|nr:PREDICTED: uncharacterized protein LOC109580184 [Amphimedon queenslandica]|eukprot:XP_019848642.1 PREDICTED: uncharacterized protein LOC109580184 [Amphimedon queenslandica]
MSGGSPHSPLFGVIDAASHALTDNTLSFTKSNINPIDIANGLYAAKGLSENVYTKITTGPPASPSKSLLLIFNDVKGNVGKNNIILFDIFLTQLVQRGMAGSKFAQTLLESYQNFVEKQEEETSTGTVYDLEAEPKLADLMNLVAAKISSDWRLVGIQLGMTNSELDAIQMDISLAGKPILMLQKVFSHWENSGIKPYTWSTVLDVLKSPSVGHNGLADSIVSSAEEQKVMKTKAIMKRALRKRYVDLCCVLSGSYDTFSRQFLSISTSYDATMREFVSILNSLTTMTKVESHCNKFLLALRSIGQPVTGAGSSIGRDWTDAVYDGVGIRLNFETTVT